MEKLQIKKLKEDSYKLLLANRREKDGFQYTLPSPTSYPYQWFWDSCFHAIVLSHFSCEDAKNELRSLVSKQFGNGLIPHMIYWRTVKGVIDEIPWGKDGTSSITQPPMLAYAVWQIFEKDKDIAFVKEIYSNLYHFYRYLLNERDPHKHNIVGIINPDESGEDNSPRFDGPMGLPPQHTLKENFAKRVELIKKNKTCDFDAPFCMKEFFWVKDVPFNSILVKNLKILSQIADKLDLKEDALYFLEKSIKITEVMRDKMLEDDIFWSVYKEDHKKIRVKTWAIFSPMFAEVCTKDEANILVKNYLENPDEFGGKLTTPTVARSDPSYDPKGFWRGPIWIATNWFIYKGLLNYGFLDEAKKIKESSIELIEKSGFREQFNSDTGEGMGAENFTWGTLIVDMFENVE